jgi:hypothetical protein
MLAVVNPNELLADPVLARFDRVSETAVEAPHPLGVLAQST